MAFPKLIQGGMGVGVSGWQLAREVAALGQLGVVSGTALDTMLIRRLALGDVGGHLRRAIRAFPFPAIADAVLDRYFHADDAPANSGDDLSTVGPDIDRPDFGPRFQIEPLPGARLTTWRTWLIVLANFTEVYLAKEGHPGMVGINYLQKIQFPTLPSLYGAMLAGVDVVLIGAGIPGAIPAVLDQLSQNKSAAISLDVLDSGQDSFELTFDPAILWSEHKDVAIPSLRRPLFFAIISSLTLAKALVKKAPGGIDGFVIEGPIAGGHNAPPRGPQKLNDRGEPIYGPRDDIDLGGLRELGVPFWLAGGYATREKLNQAIELGAQGVQVGSLFAFCEESGLQPELRRRFLASLQGSQVDVFTDPNASPTGFPFKVASLSGTLSDVQVYSERPRMCDLGYLRQAFRKADGTIGFRCSGEPIGDFVRKGGTEAETAGRKCLCNALLANIGLGQRRKDGYVEPPLLTSGDDLDCIKQFLSPTQLTYHARDVIESLL